MDNPNVAIPVNFSNYVQPLHWQGDFPLLEVFVSGYNNEDALTNPVSVVEMALVFLLQGDASKLVPLKNDLLEENVDAECYPWWVHDCERNSDAESLGDQL